MHEQFKERALIRQRKVAALKYSIWIWVFGPQLRATLVSLESLALLFIHIVKWQQLRRRLGWGVFHEVDLFYGPPSASPAAVENRKQGGWHFQRRKPRKTTSLFATTLNRKRLNMYWFWRQQRRVLPQLPRYPFQKDVCHDHTSSFQAKPFWCTTAPRVVDGYY